MTIRWKLILFICTPLVLTLGAGIAAEYRALRAAAMQATRERVVRAAEEFAATLDAHFQAAAEVSRANAAILNAVPDLPEDRIREILRQSVERSPLIYGACFAFEPHAFDAARRLFAPYYYRPDPDRALVYMDVADAYDYTDPKWEWYRRPRTTGERFWTRPFFDEGAGNVIMCTYVTPLVAEGRFRGASNVDVRLDDLQRFFSGRRTSAAEFSIMDADGTIISDPEPEIIMHETVFTLAAKLNRPRLRDLGLTVLTKRSGVEVLEILESGAPILIAFTPIPSTNWSLVAGIPVSVALGPVYGQLRSHAAIGLAVVALVTGVTVVISVLLTRPLQRLAAAVRQLGAGDLEARAPDVRSHDEIGDLASTFNAMVARLRDYVEALTRETKAREAVESELRVAREIQTSLLPREFPEAAGAGGLEVHALNVPARHVAGDFFDVFPSTEGHTVVIADVAGKGVPAAIFMAVTRTLLRNAAADGASPAEVLRRANSALLASNSGSMFVTLWLGQVHAATGRLVYANAGHPRPCLVDGQGARDFGEVTGPVLGVVEGAEHEQRSETLPRGALLLLFTDGVTEARASSGEFFGPERLWRLLTDLGPGSPEAVCREVTRVVMDFQAGDPHDDLTVLGLRLV